MGDVPDWRQTLVVVLFVLVSRLVYVPGGVMGGDGPSYVNALKLDRTYNVPPPGNIGYVLVGKAFTVLGAQNPVWAYALTDTLISCVGAVFVYLLGSLAFTRWIALATTLAVMSSVQVWYHGVIMQSYIVWLASLPMIAYFGVRFVRERTWRMLIAASLATGASTILRPDLVVFGGPLLGVCLLLGRARVLMWVACAGICAACCCVWFFGTAVLVGGPAKYIELVRAKNEWHETYSLGQRGVIEGLGRNLVKYGTFLSWSVHVGMLFAMIGAWRMMKRWREGWRWWVAAAAWAGPSLYFAWIIFMGNAGLILPALPLVYFAAAVGVGALGTAAVRRRAAWIMGGLAVVNVAQFVLTPIPEPTNQRRVLLTHMFFGYSGTGLRRVYTYELQDFGIDKSLGNTARQFWQAEPVPRQPGEVHVK